MIRKETFDTPILFLVFNRPQTTQIVFDEIKKIKPAKLFIAADGPRDFVPHEIAKCNEVKKIVSSIDWPCEINTLFRENNLGCKMAVSGAISWFFEHVDSGIILEDDCQPDLSFFHFCSELLLEYENDNEVMLIGGNNFHKNELDISSSYYFTNYPHIWGWATWKRAWKYYDLDISDYCEVLKDSYYDNLFQSKSEKKYWLGVFNNVAKGKINTWDYQLTYAIWKNRGKSITPVINLIRNIGLNGGSTHLFIRDSFRDDLKLNEMAFPLNHPSIQINRSLDSETFNNVFSKSFKRAVRIFRENRFFFLCYYVLNKYIFN
jgi:hypothetical protein